MEVKEFAELKQYVLNLPIVKKHSTNLSFDDLSKIALDVAVHVKSSDVFSKVNVKDMVDVVVHILLFVVDEFVKSDPEKSKKLKDLVKKNIPSLFLESSLVTEEGLVSFVKKLFCCWYSVKSVMVDPLTTEVEKKDDVKEVVKEVVKEDEKEGSPKNKVVAV